MGYLEALILGILQGLTEFLPVSSSGHLVIFQDLLGVVQQGITFEIMVHFGTVLSVIWVFGPDIMRILRRFAHEKQERHFALMLAVGTVPTGIIGYLLKNLFTRLYQSTLLVGFMLLVTGVILYTLHTLKPGRKNERTMTAADALIVSLAQTFAIIPGISRSGSTITSALWRSLDRETAVRFSFLLSVPVILGATLVELKDLAQAGFDGFTGSIIVGTFAAFLAGIFAIKVFIHFLKTGRFQYFAYYCWFAGLVTITLKLAGF
ncbi:MAG: undecaprenyl-diphosphate phosphatase [Dethiobacter sp.]|jgi:undecaprenyl-diphosphatase|nr:undecaprenyl-diphosphate phosphatase [Dethiobacter sp.]